MNVRHRQFDNNMIIGMLSGGIVFILTGIVQLNILVTSGGLVPVFGALAYAIVIRLKNGKHPSFEQTWEDNRESTVKFLLSVIDDDFIEMKPIIEKLESRGFDSDNESSQITLEDIEHVSPVMFKERVDKLPPIHNVLGFITYEQYNAIYNFIQYSALFIDSFCKQNYRKDLLHLKLEEAKKIIEFFSYAIKDHAGLSEWSKRILSIDSKQL